MTSSRLSDRLAGQRRRGDSGSKWIRVVMAVLATMRGIPCYYYGTEILMTGDKEKGHGFIREDFPGGWPDDTVSVFSGTGLTPLEKNAYDHLRKLLQWRK